MTKLNEDITKISEKLYQWKTSFNPDVCKLVQEVVCSRNKTINHHPAVFVNNVPIKRESFQKHLDQNISGLKN